MPNYWTTITIRLGSGPRKGQLHQNEGPAFEKLRDAIQWTEQQAADMGVYVYGPGGCYSKPLGMDGYAILFDKADQAISLNAN